MFKVGFLLNDNDMYNQFKKIDQFTEFKIFKSLNDEDVRKMNVLIVSDQIVDSTQLIHEYPSLETIDNIFYLVSNENYSNSLESVFNTMKIKIVPPKLTVTQIVQTVVSNVIGSVNFSDDNIFVFFGADSKVGTTMVSQSVAELISNNHPALKILYVSMSGMPGVDYFSNTFIDGLDTLKVKLTNSILNIDEIISSCVNVKNGLFVLKGTESFTERRHYHVKHVENLLKLVKHEFDLVILDAGSNIELGLTIGSLRASNNKFLVCTQQNRVLNHYKSMEEQILSKLQINDFMLVVNQHIQNSSLLSDFEIAKEYKGSVYLTSVPYLEWGWQCEKERHSLLKHEDKKYTEAINMVSKVVLKKINISEEEKVKKTSFFKRLIG